MRQHLRAKEARREKRQKDIALKRQIRHRKALSRRTRLTQQASPIDTFRQMILTWCRP